MTIAELFSGITVTAGLPPASLSVSSITCDSRKVEKDGIFVCINGTAADGHLFAADALKAGVAAVVTERDLGLPRQILVPSTRLAWAQLSANRFGHPADRLRLIGVTGTNGKTTTVFLLKSLLEQSGHKVGLIGTVQNMIGDRVLPAARTTPDTYELQSLFALMVAEGCDCCVMEVSSHALAQERVAGCHFDIAVFTNLTQDHLDYHGTMEAYLAAKKRLFTMCDTAIINADDPHAAALCDGLSCPVLRYSVSADTADFTAKNIHRKADGVRFELIADTQIGRVQLHIPGQFSVYNGMATAAAAIAFGLPFDSVTDGLSRAEGVKGRAEVVPTDRDFTVIIDYAHTPDGLENICKTLRECCAGRLITVFGCGGDRDRTKRPLMGKVAVTYSDLAVVTSDNPRSEDPTAIIADILVGTKRSKTPVKVIEDRTEAIHWAIRSAAPSDTVLLAGKGHETYQILRDGTVHMDEREIVADALKAL